MYGFFADRSYTSYNWIKVCACTCRLFFLVNFAIMGIATQEKGLKNSLRRSIMQLIDITIKNHVR